MNLFKTFNQTFVNLFYSQSASNCVKISFIENEWILCFLSESRRELLKNNVIILRCNCNRGWSTGLNIIIQLT